MAQIIPVDAASTEANETSPDALDVTVEAIELEKAYHEEKREKRNKLFKDIICDDATEDISSMWSLCYIVATVAVPVASTFVYTLIPAHNVIQFPEYWYELPLQGIIGLGPIWCSYIIYLCSSYMNVRCIRTKSNLLRMWLATGITIVAGFTASYMTWIYALHYHYPVPLTGYLIIWTSLMISSLMMLWNVFPLKWRKNDAFRKRMRQFIYVFLFQQFTTVEYGIVTAILLAVPNNYQWIASLFLPLVREINVWIITKLVLKVADGDLLGARIVLMQTNLTAHSLIMAITVGSIATTASTAVLLAEEFLINSFICFKILYLRRYKNDKPAMMNEVAKLLQDLGISELVECVVPPCYLLSFLVAYYGPNAEIIGDIKNGYWQYSVVDDVEHTINYLLLLWAIDSISLLTCTLLLWIFCEVNLFKVFSALLMEFGTGFCIATMASVNGVGK